MKPINPIYLIPVILGWLLTSLANANANANANASTGEQLLVTSYDSDHRTSDRDRDCQWTKRPNAPEVFYINMDKSKERKRNSEIHLTAVGLAFRRVRGLTPAEIFVPPDIESTWRTAHCKTQTSMVVPERCSVNTSSPLYPYTSIMSAMCGRGKGRNTQKELGCTTSHLVAMRDAIYSPTAQSRYALIIEDDVKFPFDVDYDMLTASAPAGFGILQLFNSNKQSMMDAWELYVKNPTALWQQSSNLKYWSTCGYLIDRMVMKPIIDKVVFEEKGWLTFKVIAGIQGPCSPPECCNADKIFQPNPPCVLASFGYQADSFLYAMTNGRSYMLNVPLIANGKGVDASTFHQEHVEMFHRAAFRKQRQLMNEMVSGRVKPPPFMKPACRRMLNETET